MPTNMLARVQNIEGITIRKIDFKPFETREVRLAHGRRSSISAAMNLRFDNEIRLHLTPSIEQQFGRNERPPLSPFASWFAGLSGSTEAVLRCLDIEKFTVTGAVFNGSSHPRIERPRGTSGDIDYPCVRPLAQLRGSAYFPDFSDEPVEVQGNYLTLCAARRAFRSPLVNLVHLGQVPERPEQNNTQPTLENIG